MKPPNRAQMEDFKQILNQEIALYETIQNQLSEKKAIVIQGDLARLVEVDNTLEKLTERARELEKDRLSLMVEMGREGDTLRTFIDSMASGEDAKILEESRNRLVAATQSIRSLSQINRDLLVQSIRLIEQSVDFIATILAPEGASYSNQGNRHRSTNPHLPVPEMNRASTICREA